MTAQYGIRVPTDGVNLTVPRPYTLAIPIGTRYRLVGVTVRVRVVAESHMPCLPCCVHEIDYRRIGAMHGRRIYRLYRIYLFQAYELTTIRYDITYDICYEI